MHPPTDPRLVPGPFVWRVGDDLALLPRTPALLDAYHHLVLRNVERLARWEPWAAAGPPTREQTLAHLEDNARGWMGGGQVPTAIAVPAPVGWLLVGSARLRIDQAAATGEVGYWIDAEFEGRGLVSRTVAALIGHAFGPLGLRHVLLRTEPDNRRSRAVAARLGFTEQRLDRASLPFPDGDRDDLVHGLSAQDWRPSGRVSR